MIIFLPILFLLISFSTSTANEEGIGYIWHLTDIHTDSFYQEGALTTCEFDEGLCCHNLPNNNIEDEDDEDDEIYLSGMYSYYYSDRFSASCDTPPETLREILRLVKYLDSEFYEAEMMLITGDFVPHGHATMTKEMVIDELQFSYDIFLDELVDYEELPIVSTSGNHESFPQSDMLGVRPFGSWVLDRFAEFQGSFLTEGDEEVIEMIQENGFYSYKVNEDIRVLAIQTEWFNLLNIHDTEEMYSEMVEFIYSTLESSRVNGEKVILMGHIPPIGEWSRLSLDWNNEYVSIVNEYHDVIMFSSWGHQHFPGFSIVRNLETNEPISMSFVGPSVSQIGGRFPMMFLYEYDKASFELLDILVIKVRTDLANENPGEGFENFHEITSMKETLEMEGLEPAHFDDLLIRLEGEADEGDGYYSENDLFHQYFMLTEGGFYYEAGRHDFSCGKLCQYDLICNSKSTSFDSFLDCMHDHGMSAVTTLNSCMRRSHPNLDFEWREFLSGIWEEYYVSGEVDEFGIDQIFESVILEEDISAVNSMYREFLSKYERK